MIRSFGLELRVGGVDAARNLVKWLDHRPIVGDEITIRLVEAEESDTPTVTERSE